jgi:hypothetical protein
VITASWVSMVLPVSLRQCLERSCYPSEVEPSHMRNGSVYLRGSGKLGEAARWLEGRGFIPSTHLPDYEGGKPR